jgi:hypothetical protein
LIWWCFLIALPSWLDCEQRQFPFAIHQPMQSKPSCQQIPWKEDQILSQQIPEGCQQMENEKTLANLAHEYRVPKKTKTSSGIESGLGMIRSAVIP